jgi:cyclophilin family peptidyl-prolyl cis-trans isomerase
MGTDKRARQKANRQARLAERQAETTKVTRERSMRRIVTVVGVVIAIIALFWVIGALRGGDETANTVSFTPTPGPTTEAEAAPEVTLLSAVPDDFVPWAGDGVLAEVEPAARNGVYSEPPPMTLDPTKKYAAVLNTSVGPIRLELFEDLAPVTVNNFVSLARDGYYDGTVFHRVLPGFMAQAGDPTGSGSGSPGYSFADEFSPDLTFVKRGQLAMANGGANTNGSQFFITFEATEFLDGLHTIFGEVVGDDTVLDEIVLVDPENPVADQKPLTVINSVTIVES